MNGCKLGDLHFLPAQTHRQEDKAAGTVERSPTPVEYLHRTATQPIFDYFRTFLRTQHEVKLLGLTGGVKILYAGPDLFLSFTSSLTSIPSESDLCLDMKNKDGEPPRDQASTDQLQIKENLLLYLLLPQGGEKKLYFHEWRRILVACWETDKERGEPFRSYSVLIHN